MRSSGYFTRIYEDVLGVILKFLKGKSEGSDRDVSTVVVLRNECTLVVMKNFLVYVISKSHSKP